MNFSYTHKFYPATVISAFKFLQKENIAELTEEINNPSRLFFTVNRDDLYKIQINNPDIDNLIKGVLRLYSGLFNNFVSIDEAYLAKMLFKSREEIYNMLVRLNKIKIAEYIPQKNTPMLILLEERLDNKNIRISTENYLQAKNKFTERMNAMIAYSENDMKCRSVQLLSYFGENNAPPCGECDVCKRRNELNLSKYEFDLLLEKIKSILVQSPSTLKDIVKQTEKTDKTIKVIRWLMDNGKISVKNDVMKWESEI
jgi:ATP-dependent DNA helicase RecQ